jgi:hypothetical protein
MSDESDNFVLRHLREMRTSLDNLRGRLDVRFDETDVRLVKIETRLADVEGLARATLTAVVGVSNRDGLGVAERLAAV